MNFLDGLGKMFGGQQPMQMENPYQAQAALQNAQMQKQRAMQMQDPQYQGGGAVGILAGLAQILRGRNIDKKADETITQALGRMTEFDTKARQSEAERQAAEDEKRFQRKLREIQETEAIKAENRPVDPYQAWLAQQSPDTIQKAFAVKAGLEARPGSGTNVTIHNPSQKNQSAFQEALGEDDAALYSQGRQKAIAAQQASNSIDALDSILSGMKTGKLQEVGGQLAQWVGAPEGANYAATEALVQERVGDIINAMKGPATDKDADRAIAQIPNMGTDARARQVIFDYMRKKAKTEIQMFDEMDRYANEKGSLQGFRPSVGRFDIDTSPLGDLTGGQGAVASGDTPPVPGARKGVGGKWYVNQGGQWFVVED